MKPRDKAFEERKREVLSAAKEEGIIVVVEASKGGVSLETVELATRLTKETAPAMYKELEERRESQK
jgi:hypothetical protein